MFERYTEKARRVIFFARYEASQFGSPYIETEHLLLGLLREDKALTNRFLRSHNAVESIRKQIQEHTIVREKVSTSVDLPLSNESKRVLAYAAEEAERLAHRHIGAEHLLLGLLREEKCIAAEILKEHGIELRTVRDELAKSPHVVEDRVRPEAPAQNAFRDLTQEAMEGQLGPVVGRELETDASIEVLSKFRNGNLLLVGDPGVGKTAVVGAVAQRIANEEAPSLTGNRILVYESKFPSSQLSGTIAQSLLNEAGTIIFVGDLRTVVRNGISSSLLEGHIRYIATTTPDDYRECLRDAPWLRSVFGRVFIHPLNEQETLSLLNARIRQFESFHEVKYSDEALQSAVKAADRYLPDFALPGKALELLDAAAVRVKIRRAAEPHELSDCRKRIKSIGNQVDSAISNHEFEKAQYYSEEHKKQLEHLRLLQEKYQPGQADSNIVGPDDVDAVISGWSEYPFRS